MYTAAYGVIAAASEPAYAYVCAEWQWLHARNGNFTHVPGKPALMPTVAAYRAAAVAAYATLAAAAGGHAAAREWYRRATAYAMP